MQKDETGRESIKQRHIGIDLEASILCRNNRIHESHHRMPTYKETHLVVTKNKSLPLTVNKRFAILARYAVISGGKFLDCGCGRGGYVRLLYERAGLNAHGVEFEPAVVESLQSDDLLRERVSQGDLEALKYSDHEWDYAMLNEVLEHVGNDQKVLQEVHRVLKPGGLLFVFSPNRWFPFETHGLTLRMTGKRIYWLPFVTYLPARLERAFFDPWARNYWQNQLRKLLVDAGFVIVERTYIWPTFENRSGSQPLLIKLFRPILRLASNLAEKTFFVRRFGVSQVLVCQKISSR